MMPYRMHVFLITLTPGKIC